MCTYAKNMHVKGEGIEDFLQKYCFGILLFVLLCIRNA